MWFPTGIAVDSRGTLWVADTQNNRVLWFLNAGQRSNGSNADGVLGQSDFASSAPGEGSLGMSGPLGLDVDRWDSLWVADGSNNRILRFDGASSLSSGSSGASGVLGQPSLVGTNPAGCSPSSLSTPVDVKVSPTSGDVFVVDYGNSRVVSGIVKTPLPALLVAPSLCLSTRVCLSISISLSSLPLPLCS